jgi:hypothetical protein
VNLIARGRHYYGIIRKGVPLVRCRLSLFIVERDISVAGAPVKSNILKSRYQTNVQLRMIYLTNETGPLKLFKRPSYLSLNVTFKFFHTPSTFGTRNGNDTGGNFFIRFGFPDYWMGGAYCAPNPKLLSSTLWV